MISSQKFRRWIGTRGYEYFIKRGFIQYKLMRPTHNLYEKLKYEIVNVNRNDVSCKQDLTDLSNNFLNFLDIDKLLLNKDEFPSWLHWSIQNLKKFKGESRNYSYKKAYEKSFNCYLELEHGEEKETFMEAFLNRPPLHNELLVYGHTKRQRPPYRVRIRTEGFSGLINMSFLILDKQITSIENSAGFLEDCNFPYQRQRLLKISPKKDSFVIETMFRYLKEGIQREEKIWKSVDNFHHKDQCYHVYVGEILVI